MSTRQLAHAVLDALEVGDVDEAVARCLSALEDVPPAFGRHRCPTCGLRFRFPGELDHHARVSGHAIAKAA